MQLHGQGKRRAHMRVPVLPQSTTKMYSGRPDSCSAASAA